VVAIGISFCLSQPQPTAVAGLSASGGNRTAHVQHDPTLGWIEDRLLPRCRGRKCVGEVESGWLNCPLLRLVSALSGAGSVARLPTRHRRLWKGYFDFFLRQKRSTMAWFDIQLWTDIQIQFTSQNARISKPQRICTKAQPTAHSARGSQHKGLVLQRDPLAEWLRPDGYR